MIGRVFAWEMRGEIVPRWCEAVRRARWRSLLLVAGCAGDGRPHQGLAGGSEGSGGRREGEGAVAGPDQEELRGGVRVFQPSVEGSDDRWPRSRRRSRPIQYRAVKIDKVECAAEVCTVKLTLTYDYPPAKTKGVVTPLDENWIIDQGQAWFVFRG